ncbi:MAG TPA: ROK family transcriptional regulator [Kineosporiaceae bacterium]|nr:ROK family transcriptional regulator [Kineosporiaceae bacterium]
MAGNRVAPARQVSLREHNLALVLAEVADRGPVSRAGIAAATGLTKATVSALVDALAGAGLVTEQDRAPATGAVGRPGAPLGLAPPGPVGIGLEINVDYLATCTVDLSGEVRGRRVLAGDVRDRPQGAVLDLAAAAVAEAVDEARASGAEVAGLAVAVPGLVETRQPVLRLAPNLGWHDVPVLDELRARLADQGATGGPPMRLDDLPIRLDGLPMRLDGLPMRLDNEANLAALGELWCGGHHTADDAPLTTFVHVSGEIGIGAGLVVGGRLFRGVRGFSGEIGHLPVRDCGPVCRCGSVGCLEQAAGQDAILRAAGLEGRAGSVNGGGGGPLDELVAQAAAGRERAVGAIRDAGRWLGTGVAALVNVVDVDAVVLGGGFARLAPWLRGPVEDELGRRVLSAQWAAPRVLVSALGAQAAVRGAATSVVRDVIADPAGYLARIARP